MRKGLCAKSHALTLSTFQSNTEKSINIHKIKIKSKPNQPSSVKYSAAEQMKTYVI